MASSKKRRPKSSARELPHEKADSGIQMEIIFCLALGASVLLFVSNFGIGGLVGNAVSSFFFGLFGIMSYVFPFVLFLGFSFYMANRRNSLIKRKMAGLILLFIFLCAFMQLVTMGEFVRSTPITDYYVISSEDHTGGGLAGGFLVFIFAFAFSIVGAYILTIVGLVISAVILTQKPLISNLGAKSRAAAKRARENRAEVRRVRALQKEEEAALRKKEAENEAKMAAKNQPIPKKPEIADEKPVKPAADLNDIVIEGVGQQNKSTEGLPLFLRGVLPAKSQKTSAASEETIKEEPNDKDDDPEIPGYSTAEKPQKSSKEEIEKGIASIKEEITDKESAPPKYELPPVSMLTKGNVQAGDSRQTLMDTAAKLQQIFVNFGVNVRVTNVSQGPTVTRYELQPEQGVKVSRILSLSDDIKLNLATSEIRIEAPIPGKAAVGIEVPNKENSPVMLRELVDTPEFRNSKAKLAFAVGKDIGGKAVIADIEKMPHLLIAGATGSGKSVCINTLIMSILYKSTPDEVKMLMIDPKVVELKIYDGIPHLLIPVVTDAKKAAGALNWAVQEMTERYNKFAEYNGVRDLRSYNERIDHMNADPACVNKQKRLPQILIIVDELADLMMVAPGEVEDAICRLAQLARAAGLHLIIATQRPSVNVVTGLIKANMPSRIALAVTSGVDSRTILDMNGAEKLLGKGDMLFYPQGYPKPARVQGAYVSDEDITAVVKFLSSQKGEVVYNTEVEDKITETINNTPAPGSSSDDDRDEYFVEAGKFIIDKDKASIGMLQRVFKIGFNRAARIMDQLCEAGVVGEEEGTKPRKILMTMEEFEDFSRAE